MFSNGFGELVCVHTSRGSATLVSVEAVVVLEEAKSGDPSRSVDVQACMEGADPGSSNGLLQEEQTFRMGVCAFMFLHLSCTSVVRVMLAWVVCHGSHPDAGREPS